MAKTGASKKKGAKKAASKSPIGPLTKAGSPIIIGGGGSVWIEYIKERDYPNHTTGPDDHDGPSSSQIGTFEITDNSGRKIDLSPLLPSDRRHCNIKIHGKVEDSDETITIKGKPLGVNFKSGTYRKGSNAQWPNQYYSHLTEIGRIVFKYPGWGKIVFEGPAVGICSIKVGP